MSKYVPNPTAEDVEQFVGSCATLKNPIERHISEFKKKLATCLKWLAGNRVTKRALSDLDIAILNDGDPQTNSIAVELCARFHMKERLEHTKVTGDVFRAPYKSLTTDSRAANLTTHDGLYRLAWGLVNYSTFLKLRGSHVEEYSLREAFTTIDFYNRDGGWALYPEHTDSGTGNKAFDYAIRLAGHDPLQSLRALFEVKFDIRANQQLVLDDVKKLTNPLSFEAMRAYNRYVVFVGSPESYTILWSHHSILNPILPLDKNRQAAYVRSFKNVPDTNNNTIVDISLSFTIKKIFDTGENMQTYPMRTVVWQIISDDDATFNSATCLFLEAAPKKIHQRKNWLAKLETAAAVLNTATNTSTTTPHDVQKQDDLQPSESHFDLGFLDEPTINNVSSLDNNDSCIDDEYPQDGEDYYDDDENEDTEFPKRSIG